jgi:hypothetical protein
LAGAEDGAVGLASHTLAFEGDFEGCEEDKERRLGADSLIPKRIKFQKFVR